MRKFNVQLTIAVQGTDQKIISSMEGIPEDRLMPVLQDMPFDILVRALEMTLEKEPRK
jgi:hypothetical protein